MTGNWSDIEVELVVEDYFSMLLDELKGKMVNKTEHRGALKSMLNNRSDGSIEFKHQNISAVLISLGLPFIKGYKPRFNFQKILEEKIIDYVHRQKIRLKTQFDQFAELVVFEANEPNFSEMLDSPPGKKNMINELDFQYSRKPIKVNYLEREQNNSFLGNKGEAMVINYEKWRLSSFGKENLVDKIEWISQFDDGAGFDILSKNIDGTDRYIEVKTTKLSKETPIFFSRTEYDFSVKMKTSYHLYRLFNFRDNPKLFQMNGSFDNFCTKEVTQYKGYF